MKAPERAIVRVPACGIFSEPTFKSEMVNQALMWEEVLISDKKDNWYKIQLEHDGYQGWINKMYLSFSKKAFYSKEKYPLFTSVYTFDSHSFKGGLFHYPVIFSAGCRVPCTSFKRIGRGSNSYYDMNFLAFDPCGSIEEFKIKFDWMHDVFIGETKDEIRRLDAWPFILEDEHSFYGRPYLWGGRSCMGYDCSGFIQTIFRLRYSDYDFPRDAREQVNYSKLTEVLSHNEIEDGDLLFFKKGSTVDHVAIATIGYCININHPDELDDDPGDWIMHASGDKGIVCEESLEASGLMGSLYKVMRYYREPV